MVTMLEYRTLENTPMPILYEAFLRAFADYQVPIDLSFTKFEYMLVRRGFVPELSVGAFINQELIGFILNGNRIWQGKDTLYDCGTGVLPAWRKQGITTNLFREVQNILSERQLNQYLLEVIETNSAAVELYSKQGFAVTRSLLCYRAGHVELTENLGSPRVIIKKEPAESGIWEEFQDFWDSQPSWQNSIASILAVTRNVQLLTARLDHKVVGYGVIDQNTGDIAQIAVHKQFRRQGIGTALLYRLAEVADSPKISIINVDERDNILPAFLEHTGFIQFARQFEMILKAKNFQ